VLLAGRIEIGSGGPATAARSSGNRINHDLVQLAQVDHQAAFGGRDARKAVPATADRDL
jgi:hypothetical protein